MAGHKETLGARLLRCLSDAEMSPSDTDGQTAMGRVVVERPPPGLARGKYPMPPWAIAIVGGITFLAGLAYVLRRFVGRFKR